MPSWILNSHLYPHPCLQVVSTQPWPLLTTSTTTILVQAISSHRD